MFYKEVIEAAAQRRDLLRGGVLTTVADLAAVAQDRRDVLVDGQWPIGIGRYPLLGLQFEAELRGMGLDPLLTSGAAREDIRTAWAIMLNLPISPSVRGPSSSSAHIRAHFGTAAYDDDDLTWWSASIEAIIRARPAHLLSWLANVRTQDPVAYEHLISMDLVQALAARPDLETSDWPSSLRTPPIIRPFHALACLCEFVRIAQTYRALLHWSFVELGRDMTTDTVVKMIRTSHGPRTTSQVVKRLVENARLQTIGFGHDVDQPINDRSLLSRQGVLTLAASQGQGAVSGRFVAASDKASAADLATSMGAHPLYRTIKDTARVKRENAITYWGMTYRDFVGVMLLDLADAARYLEKGTGRGKFYKPDRLRRAIVQVELSWLEQVSTKALTERLQQIKSGARGEGGELPMPQSAGYSPQALVDCLSAPAAQNFRAWTKKCEHLPTIGSEGSIIRSRPDLWWTGLTEVDLASFRRARTQSQKAVAEVSRAYSGEFPITPQPHASSYRSALAHVMAVQQVGSTSSITNETLALVASADCALLLSPLSMDPQRSLFEPKRRAIAVR